MPRKSSFLAFISFTVLAVFPSFVCAQDVSPAFRSTEYALPRYVSLSSDMIHARTGPGLKYPIQWVFRKKDLPVEIVLEYETWRKIRDHEGEGGWVHQSLLSGKRSVLILHDDLVPVRKAAGPEERVIAYFEPNLVADLGACKQGWCRIAASGYQGWVERKHIWGIYEGENFD